MSYMLDENQDSPRRRQPSAEATAGREALMLVRQLNRQLGLWQAASVKLQTMAERLRATGRNDATVEEETRTLMAAVLAAAERFEEMLSGQRAAVAQHGRIKDTRRSFEMVTERLRGSLRLLGVEEVSE
jgi:hypothetical protein